MYQSIKVFIVLFLLGLSTPGTGQSSFSFFSEANQLPEGLLKERSVVFVKDKALNWEVKAAKVHDQLRRAGVDAVAYYALSDILSGEDATRSFYNDIKDRSINQVIIADVSKQDVTLYFTAIPETGGFFKEGMQAYTITAPDITMAGNQLYKQVYSQKLERGNFLIIDQPEVFKNTHVVTARRVEAFNQDIRIDKLAVPKFTASMMGDIDPEQANAALDSIFSKYYPYEYGLVDPGMTADEMISQGYLMVLKKLHNNGESIKRMLGYNLDKNETLYISVKKGPEGEVRKYSPSDDVFKYYVQQLYTKDIYLGNEWDAGHTWQIALKTHIANLKAATLRK